jgi:ribose-phosphate pyrophosphokinase
MPKKSLVGIFAGRATKYLAERITEQYGTELGHTTVNVFSDGEFMTSYDDNIRGRDVFIVQSTFSPTENVFELLMMIDAARRASAMNIVAVMPYFGFARQDRKDRPRVSITAKMIANLLQAAGVTRIITLDLHADQIQGFFDVPVDHLYASSIFIPYLRSLGLKNLTMASPDTGGTRRAATYAKAMNTDFVICYKQRAKPNEIARMALVGDVKGRDVVLVDDIIDTAGSITRAAQLIMENGASSVRAFCTHPVFSGEAYNRIEASAFKEVVVTDTIPLKKDMDKITVISTAGLFADVIRRVITNKSISNLFRLTDNK